MIWWLKMEWIWALEKLTENLNEWKETIETVFNDRINGLKAASTLFGRRWFFC